MTAQSSVYFIFAIMTCFHTSVVTRSGQIDVTIWMNINNVSAAGCTKHEDGACYYKDGDLLLWFCMRGIFNNYPRLYHCKKGMKKEGDWSMCDVRIYTSTTDGLFYLYLRLTKDYDNSVIICEYADIEGMKQMQTRLVLKSDEPPTVIINNLQFNKSLSYPNIYEGKVGENLNIVCKKNEKSGTLQWNYCKNSTKGLTGVSCLTQEDNGQQITYYPDLELAQKHNGTEIKCVYTNLSRNKLTTSVLIYLIPDSKATPIRFVIGAVVATLLICAILVTVCIFFYRRKAQTQTRPPQPTPIPIQTEPIVYYTIDGDDYDEENSPYSYAYARPETLRTNVACNALYDTVSDQ